MSTKLNVLLAKTDSLAPSWKQMVADFAKFFKQKQGAFLGEKKTYTAREDTMDDPGRRGNVLIQATVDEKFKWFRENSKEYIDALFSQEKTNASGNAKAELVVAGESWGEFTSLELLRLKGLIESNSLYTMLSGIPVRSDSEEWAESQAEMHGDRAIFEMPMLSGINKTTEKETYVLKDPNVSADSAAYTPSLAVKTTTIELGDFTVQKFSGEWSQRQRAEALAKRTVLITAVVTALKTCNEVEATASDLTSDKIFGYLLS
jgi:hypothetical protein